MKNRTQWANFACMMGGGIGGLIVAWVAGWKAEWAGAVAVYVGSIVGSGLFLLGLLFTVTLREFREGERYLREKDERIED